MHEKVARSGRLTSHDTDGLSVRVSSSLLLVRLGKKGAPKVYCRGGELKEIYARHAVHEGLCRVCVRVRVRKCVQRGRSIYACTNW